MSSGQSSNSYKRGRYADKEERKLILQGEARAQSLASRTRGGTRRGADLLGQRLLQGEMGYVDLCVAQLIGMNVGIRDSRPLAGSRKHFSLVDGGQMQNEEMPT